jgi:two-component system cell cycle sensor histidine kinase/response regulator CckA
MGLAPILVMRYAIASEPVANQVKDRTILLAEDEDALRLLVLRVLVKAGYRVLQARNGAEAAVIWRRHAKDVDMLVTDVVMPHMDGPTLARELSAEGAKFKLLYMSGYNQDAMVHRGIQTNQIAFLQKPFTPAELIAKVQEIFDT